MLKLSYITCDMTKNCSCLFLQHSSLKCHSHGQLNYQDPVFVLLCYVNFVYNTFQMGGRSNVQNEVLCRFIFPERPGALMKFLDSFSPRWNISLFHYRGQVRISGFLPFFFQDRNFWLSISIVKHTA